MTLSVILKVAVAWLWGGSWGGWARVIKGTYEVIKSSGDQWWGDLSFVTPGGALASQLGFHLRAWLWLQAMLTPRLPRQHRAAPRGHTGVPEPEPRLRSLPTRMLGLERNEPSSPDTHTYTHTHTHTHSLTHTHTHTLIFTHTHTSSHTHTLTHTHTHTHLHTHTP